MVFHVLITTFDKNSHYDSEKYYFDLDLARLSEIDSNILKFPLFSGKVLIGGYLINSEDVKRIRVYKTNRNCLVSTKNSYKPDRTKLRYDQYVAKFLEKNATNIPLQRLSKSENIKKTIDTNKIGSGNIGEKTTVFIVHGHDNEAKQEVARFVEKSGLEAVILHEQANQGKTIIEKLENYSDVGFGIILYTACDVGAKASPEPELNPRARQNVVFEHGYLIAKLGRQRVCALVKGNVETPSDILGLMYINMDKADWQINLAREMQKEYGGVIDLNKIYS
ncbi:MAG: TIR domain-containing protein [Synechococcus sp.]